MPKDYKKVATDVYKDKTGPFEGVREVGRAVGGAVKKAAQAVGDRMPKFSPAQPATKEVYKVEGPFTSSGMTHMDMTPHTMMNNPKKYKKG
jgi:hypothetical protein